MYSTVTFLPWCATCSEGIRTLHSVFPAGHAMNPVVQLTGMHGDLDYSLLPKRNQGTVGTLCLDPFLTVCTNGSPALHGREASQYSSVPSRACRPTFEMFPRPKHSELFSHLDHLNLRLGPNPTVTLRRLRPCFCSHRLTPLRLSPADTPPLLLLSLTHS